MATLKCKVCNGSLEILERYRDSAMCVPCGRRDAREYSAKYRRRKYATRISSEYVVFPKDASPQWMADRERRIRAKTREASKMREMLSDAQYL